MATILDGFKLEVAFVSGPFDSAPTWTDITAYWVMAQPTQITRGRGSEQDQVQTGTLGLTLDNTDGRFTVDNTASPYYPNVKLRKQIRITYTQSATTYPIFKGNVDEWPVEWPDGGEQYAWAQVRASDRFKTLGTPSPLRSVPEEEVLLSTPQQYFPMGEGDGATVAGDVSGNQAPNLTISPSYGFAGGGSITFGAGTGPGLDGLTAPMFAVGSTDQSSGKLLQGGGTFGGGAGLSVEVVLNSTQNSYNMGILSIGVSGGPFVTLFGQSALNLAIDPGTASVESASSSSVSVADGRTHHVALTITANAGGSVFRVYFDGVLVLTWTSAVAEFVSATLPTMTGWTVGGYVFPDATNGGKIYSGFTGTMSHAAIFGSALDATTVARHYGAMVTGFAGESTGARAARVADWAGVASGDRIIDTGNTTSVRHVDTTGKTAQGFLQELADTEGGLVFIDASGKLRFQQRGTRINSTSALTLSAASQQVSDDVAYRSNDQFLRNDVTYYRSGGITYRATDATSIADYGPYIVSQETYTTSDAEVRDHATWVVNTSDTPSARIERLGVDMLTDSASRIAAVQLDLSSKVTVTNMPTAAPSATTSVFVEGYTETISLTEWRRELNTSPAAQFSPLWQLGAVGFGELGTTTTLNF